MALDYPVILNAIMTYPDFIILELESGDEVMYFEVSDEGMGAKVWPLELVAHMYYDEYEDKSEEELIDAVEDYDISGETDDSQMYMYFRYI